MNTLHCVQPGVNTNTSLSRYLYFWLWPLSHPSQKCRRRWLVGWWWWWWWVMTVLGFYNKTPVLGKQKTKQSDDRWGTRAEWSVTTPHRLPPRTWEIRVDLLWCGCLEPYLTRLISSDIKTYLPHNLDDVWHCDTLIDRWHYLQAETTDGGMGRRDRVSTIFGEGPCSLLGSS